MTVWKRYPTAVVWLNWVAASTVVFWLSDWDLRVTAWFYQPACSPQGWLLDCYPLFYALFYASIPFVSLGIFFGCLGVVVWTSWRGRHLRLRLHAAYFLLVFILGSGLLVNSVFKDHWGRPRPVQVEDFGGKQAYAPPLYYVSGSDGRSFPSGHSSVGFTFIGLWFLWRRSHPQRARLALWGTLVFGALVGVTRMAAGGHFLSDVIWSAWMVAFAAWLVYYPLLTIPQRERRIAG